MALPKIDLPLFEIEIPSTKKKIKFRPFTVKEEKILLIAQESKDIDHIFTAIKQIIDNCTVGITSAELATFDLEYLMINIRAKSVNNIIEYKIKDPDTKEVIELELDIEDVKVSFKDGHTKLIKVDDETHIIMRYPTVDQLAQMVKTKDAESIFGVMVSCIDKIEQGDTVYKSEEYTSAELVQFVESLSSSTLADIQKFFDTLPVLRFEQKYKTKDGKDKVFVVEGMETFFI